MQELASQVTHKFLERIAESVQATKADEARADSKKRLRIVFLEEKKVFFLRDRESLRAASVQASLAVAQSESDYYSTRR